MIRILACSISLFALVAGTPAIAEDASVPTINVGYTDLDLARGAGITTLRQRVKHAIDFVCGSPDNRDLGAMAAARTCRKTAAMTTETQIASIVDQTRRLAQRTDNTQTASR